MAHPLPACPLVDDAMAQPCVHNVDVGCTPGRGLALVLSEAAKQNAMLRNCPVEALAGLGKTKPYGCKEKANAKYNDLMHSCLATPGTTLQAHANLN